MQGDFAAEFFGLPTYFITNVVCEAAGSNVRVYHWEKRGSILAPQFIAVMAATDLVTISQEVQATAYKTLLEIGMVTRGH